MFQKLFSIAERHLDRLHHVVGSLGGKGELGDGLAELLGGLLVLLLHEHDPPGEGGDVALHLLELLLSLLEGLGGLGQLVVGLIKVDLKLLYFIVSSARLGRSMMQRSITLRGFTVGWTPSGRRPSPTLFRGLSRQTSPSTKKM